MTPCYSIDWLSFFVNLHGTPLLAVDDYTYAAGPFSVVYRPGVSSSSFSCLHDVLYNDVPFAVIQSRPHSTFITENCGVMKIDNAVLYMQGWQRLVRLCLQVLRVSVLSVSRLDVCVDVLDVAGMALPAFARGCLSGAFRRAGSRSFYAVAHDYTAIKGITQTEQQRRRGRGFVVQTSTNYRCDGSGEVSYLCWGSRRSDCRFYIYDKTKELREVKDKTYIRDMWRRAGWNEKDAVYRCEWSLQGSRLVAQNIGELKLSLLHLLGTNDYSIIVSNLLRRFADFRKSDNPRFDRCTPMPLFDVAAGQTLQIARKETMHSTGWSDKVAAKKMYEVLDAMPEPLAKYFARWYDRYLSEMELGGWAAARGLAFSSKQKHLAERQAQSSLSFSDEVDAWAVGNNILINAAGREFDAVSFWTNDSGGGSQLSLFD